MSANDRRWGQGQGMSRCCEVMISGRRMCLWRAVDGSGSDPSGAVRNDPTQGDAGMTEGAGVGTEKAVTIDHDARAPVPGTKQMIWPVASNNP